MNKIYQYLKPRRKDMINKIKIDNAADLLSYIIDSALPQEGIVVYWGTLLDRVVLSDELKLQLASGNRCSNLKNFMYYNLNITKELADKYINDNNQELILNKLNFDEDFVDSHSNIIDWYLISENLSLFSDKFIDKYKDKIIWSSVSIYADSVSDEFLDKYKKYICWEKVNLPFERIVNYLEYMDIFRLTSKYKLPEEIIDLYPDEVDWEYISKHYNLSEELIEKFSDKLNWWSMIKRYSVSDDIVAKYMKHDITEDLYKEENLNLLIKYANLLDWDYVSRMITKVKWIDKLQHNLNWDILSSRIKNRELKLTSTLIKIPYLKLDLDTIRELM